MKPENHEQQMRRLARRVSGARALLKASPSMIAASNLQRAQREHRDAVRKSLRLVYSGEDS